MKLLTEQSAKGESNQVLLRSKLRAVSRRLGFNDVARERMELVCNEVMTNQHKFARGTGVVQLWEAAAPTPALDLFALDYGPGIADLPRAVADGYTTASTMGKGLGAIKRLAHTAEIYTVPDQRRSDRPWHGTAVWARFYQQADAAPAPVTHGSFTRAYLDDPYCGDLIHVRHAPGKIRWLHVDGLGHGRDAHSAVDGLPALLDDDTEPLTVLNRVDARLKQGRGAVGVVCEVDRARGQARLCGVGDMTAVLIQNGEKRSINFSAGILGHAHRGADVMTLPLPPPALLITATDGLRRNWTLDSFPELWRLHPQMIAFVLGTVAGRVNDDQSVFVVNNNL